MQYFLLVATNIKSMYPELFHFGSFTVYGYGFCIMFGSILGYLYALVEGKRQQIPPEKIAEMCVLMFIASFIGGKVFLWFPDWRDYLQNPDKLLSSFGGSGFVFYGSFIFSIITLRWFFKKNQLKPGVMFDILAITGTIVHGFGKIGCLLAGCCYGKVCSPVFGITYTNPHSQAEPLNMPLYPVPVIDALIIFTCTAILFYMKKRKQFDGQLMLIYGLFYGAGRFITEFLRGDENRGYIGPLSQSQWIALIIIGVCLIMHRRLSTRHHTALQ